MGLIDRFQNAWNVFANKDPTERLMYDMSTGPSYSYRPDITPTLLFLLFIKGVEQSLNLLHEIFSRLCLM